MYCTNFKHVNHNVERCRNKKLDEPIQTIANVTTQASKSSKLVKYSCHICGIGKHKLSKCPRFIAMQNCFKGNMKP